MFALCVSYASFDDGFHVRNLRLQLRQKGKEAVVSFPGGEVGDLKKAE